MGLRAISNDLFFFFYADYILKNLESTCLLNQIIICSRVHSQQFSLVLTWMKLHDQVSSRRSRSADGPGGITVLTCDHSDHRSR